MKGAIAEPPPITRITPNKRSTIITGASQNFFLLIKNLQMSVKKSIINLILSLLVKSLQFFHQQPF